MLNNLWKGKRVDYFEMIQLLETLAVEQIATKPLSQHIVLNTLKKMRNEISKKEILYKELILSLKAVSENPEADLEELLSFIDPQFLKTKMKRELGDENPFELKRINGRSESFEAWYPLGIITHITPNNASMLSVCALIESLICGNVNFLKLGRKEGEFAALFFERLISLDHLDQLKNYIYVLQISSKEADKIKKILNFSHAVSVWGNEESVVNVKKMCPSNIRVIQWGHKISFSYFSPDYLEEDVKLLAKEICQNDQLFCSSPQCVYLEDADFLKLKSFGNQLKVALEKEVKNHSKSQLSALTNEEKAEITVTKEVLNLRSITEDCALIDGGDFRIYIDHHSTLTASPLFKTIWLKPMKRSKLVFELRGFSNYLQTVGVATSAHDYEEIVNLLIEAGALRIRNIGDMLTSYEGEPHDGEFALTRFLKRINVMDSKNRYMKEKYSFEENSLSNIDHSKKIMQKNDFQSQVIKESDSDLFFHSGGSSGEPKLSVFTYSDYYRQMEMASEGLYAAGLDPKIDRTMNLFYAGNLYGGFTSFFTILEKLNAVQFPMGASTDFEMVGKTIVKNKVDTLLGMPSYILELFRKNHELFKSYKGIKKIFFGGEHFSQTQRDYLISEYHVSFIRSASYGSVDAGPLGYQCQFSEGSAYHLYEKLHDLEFVDLEKDQATKTGEVGRLLFTSKVRSGQDISRYEIGDIGRELTGMCACGRKGKRFELLGRHGDVFRSGTIFLSYQKFEKILIDLYDFKGQFQIHIHPATEKNVETVEVLVAGIEMNQTELKTSILRKYEDLRLVVEVDQVLNFELKITKVEELVFNQKTGKLKSVIDHRP